MSPNDRISQISSHLNYPRGLLAGQTAIITGAGQGIGAETARLFANEGAKVIISDIDAEKASTVANAINSNGGKALAVVGDMLDDAYLKTLVEKAAEFGHGKIHIIVNNAGFTWDGVIHKVCSLPSSFHASISNTRETQTTDKQWDTIMSLHVSAPFKLIRNAAPYFRVKDNQPRNIINISSTSGLHGNAGQANYAAAKAAVTGLTKTIAKEWGPAFGVRCNTIAYGHIATRLTAAKEEGAFVTTPDGEKIALGIPGVQKKGREEGVGAFKDIPLGRPGTATEAAGVILGVVSPYFSYVTGQTISVTGGRNI
jgi:3-oxoacyl-[acyl-carrier protein] reductase